MAPPPATHPENAPIVQTIDPSIALEGTGDERPVHPVSRRHGADRVYRGHGRHQRALRGRGFGDGAALRPRSGPRSRGLTAQQQAMVADILAMYREMLPQEEQITDEQREQ